MQPLVGPPLIAKLRSGPGRVRRSSGRLTRAALFALETISDLRSARFPVGVQEKARRLSWVTENMCALHGIQVVCEGSVPDGPVVVASNHLSYIDPLAICSLLPCVPIAKREIAGWPVLGDVFSGLGLLLVDRDCALSGARVLLQSRGVLRDQASVLTFPEGTTTDGTDVLPFRRGIFGLAQIENVPVVPVGVRYDSAELCWIGGDTFVPHYVKTTSRDSTQVRVVFGAPIDPRSFPTAQALAECVRQQVRAMITS
ncbi:MAG: lysophospholipid acyltransferase family protein [Myxococcota bacterium]